MGSSLSEAEAGHCPWFMVRHSLPATKVDTSAYIPEFVLPLSSSHSPRCRRRRSSFVLRPPSRCVHPDILTNNFIDALFLAVCVWFLIVAQLRWTHVIIAHFMTHLSKCVPRSFPFSSSSLALAFRLSFVRGDFLQHAASDSRTSILLYPVPWLPSPFISGSDPTVTRHLFGRDSSTPDCHFPISGIRDMPAKVYLTWQFKTSASLDEHIKSCCSQMMLQLNFKILKLYKGDLKKCNWRSKLF